ncbi:DUF6471 domain-containing protein [Pseudodesulfovibrio methanolicus]|uniref:DUF6471 domain-containing protein n=1 Tax=Pseudodesulfovibrio methanolicus TaxID=3126690 RepID=A0ABZ2IW65_9BACT
MGMTLKWNEEQARNTLKALLASQGLKVADLADRLNAIGVHETQKSIYGKLQRGTFTLAWFLQILKALGLKLETKNI